MSDGISQRIEALKVKVLLHKTPQGIYRVEVTSLGDVTYTALGSGYSADAALGAAFYSLANKYSMAVQPDFSYEFDL